MKTCNEIYVDDNRVTVDAVQNDFSGNNVDGHKYEWRAGNSSGVISFQHGPVKECGVNGLTNEALLSILLHRTEYLDKQFPCDENKLAIQHMVDAQMAFESRTEKRKSRGVEGTNQA